MKHATSRMLFAFWDALRGERAAPERGEIRPGELRHILADTFILDADAGQGPAFRLAGTRVCALFGLELKDVPFAAIFHDAEATEALGLARMVTADTIGIVAGLVGTNVDGSDLALEIVLLPLRHRGRPHARILGALSPATLPSWAGLVPLAGLSIRSARAIQAAPRLSATDTSRIAATRRQLFVLHEGGLR